MYHLPSKWDQSLDLDKLSWSKSEMGRQNHIHEKKSYIWSPIFLIKTETHFFAEKSEIKTFIK